MNAQKKKPTAQRIERILAVAALFIIIAAWFLGRSQAEADLVPSLKQALPDAIHFSSLSGDIYSAWNTETEEELIGYVALGSSQGFGGELRTAVAVSPAEEVMPRL